MPSSSIRSGRVVLVLAGLGGAGTMAVELAAVRLLAPWFGTSLAVWTNVIGVILLALSLGYLLGARLARGADPLARMGLLLLLASMGTGLMPAVAGPAAGLFLPAEIMLDEALPLVLWGSLATSLVLFLLPATMLGAVAPLAVETLQRATGGHAGGAGGRVLAASTVGSMFGVFGTTHLLVPTLGLSGTFLCASMALALAGATGLWLTRRGGQALGGLIVPLAIAGLPPALTPGPRPGWEVLASVESPYQSLRVSEYRIGPIPMRHLQVNEGFDSFQSVWQPAPGLLPEGYYYNYFALPLYWGAMRGPTRVLVLGLGAGTAWRVLEGVAPAETQLLLEGIELDPSVLSLARQYMGLPDDDARHAAIGGVDARVALSFPRDPADLIVLDCYANQVEIPAHLATVEFLRRVEQSLAPGGWLALNLGGFGFEDPLVAALAATTSEAFDDQVLLLRVPSSRNVVLFARRDAGLPVHAGGLRSVSGPVGDLLRPLEIPGGYRIVDSSYGRVLTDDDAPVERLQMRSMAEARARLEGDS